MSVLAFLFFFIGYIVESEGREPPPSIAVRNPASPWSLEQDSEILQKEIDQLDQDRLDFIHRKEELKSRIKALKKQEVVAARKYEEVVKEGNREIETHSRFYSHLKEARFHHSKVVSDASVTAFEQQYRILKLQQQQLMEAGRAEKRLLDQQRSDLQFEFEGLIRDKEADIKLALYRMGKLKNLNRKLKIKNAALGLFKMIRSEGSKFKLGARKASVFLSSEEHSGQRKEYFAEHSAGRTVFVQYEVPGDGDCGYHSLGIKRSEAIGKIESRLDDPSMRRMFAGSIFVDSALGDFDGNEPGSENPESWIPSPDMVKRYLKDKVSQEWLTVGASEEIQGQTTQIIDEMPKIHDPGSTLEAISFVQKLNTRVWTVVPVRDRPRNVIRLSAIFTYGENREFEDILNLGGYHFVPLAKKDDSSRNELLLQREKNGRQHRGVSYSDFANGNLQGVTPVK